MTQEPMNMELLRIVIGVDFSPASVAAVRWATQHFGRGAELLLIHAVSAKPPVDDGQKRLQDLADSMSAQSIRVEIREGEAAPSLSLVAEEFNAQMVIVGARGERADLERALGTTAQHAVRESAVPVLVVARPDDQPISKILVAVEDEVTARQSLQWAGMLSNRFNADVTTLYVAGAGVISHAASPEDSPHPASWSDDKAGIVDSGRKDKWSELARASGIAGERVKSEEGIGVPAVEIISAIERNGANILVMGRRATRNLRRAVLGSVTATVLSNPPCNVLVVPA